MILFNKIKVSNLQIKFIIIIGGIKEEYKNPNNKNI